MLKSRPLVFALGLATLVLLGLVGGHLSTRAHAGGTDIPSDRFDPYLHRTTGELADPINLVFVGGDADQTATAIQRVLGWPHVDGSALVFEDQGTSRPAAWQYGLPLAPGSRFHLRIEAVTSTDKQPYVLVGAHRDDSVACGHVGHNFNSTRDMIARAFGHLGYVVTSVHLGNTQPGRQCDDSMTAGDGTVKVIDLRTGHLPPSEPLFPVGSGWVPPIYLP